MSLRLHCRLWAVCLLLPLSAWAQRQPESWRVGRLPDVAPENLPAIDASRLMTEDAERERQAGNAIPLRYGQLQNTSIGTSNGGVWTDLPDGSRIWRGSVRTPGALSQQPIFDRFEVPPGASVYLYTPDRRIVRGPFTAADAPNGIFSQYPLDGSELVIEYHQPAGVRGGRIALSGVVGVFRPITTTAKAYGFGVAGACHPNINCPDGAPWRDQQRSVVLMLMNGFLCTGSLVNNTAFDRRPYILSGNHCFEAPPGTPATWLYVFNYESPQCTPSTEGAIDQTVTGSTLRARFVPSDMMLLELNQAVPAGYNPFWAGWNRIDAPVDRTVSIHHPRGDLKKIAFDDQAPTSASVTIAGTASGTNATWRVVFDRNTATEGGSSGSALYDPNRRIIGTLWGGASNCSGSSGNGLQDYYGKVSFGWEGGGTAATRLRDWLDPSNTGVEVLDGVNLRCISASNAVNGSSVSQVQWNGLTVGTSGGCNTYTNNAAAILSYDCAGSNTLRVTSSVCAGNNSQQRTISVFVDWNRDGNYTESERITQSTAQSGASFQVDIPISAPGVVGDFPLRIINTDGTAAVTSGCGTYASGETEDFTLRFAGAASVDTTGLTVPTSVAAVCQGDELNVPFSGLRPCLTYRIRSGTISVVGRVTASGIAYPTNLLPAGSQQLQVEVTNGTSTTTLVRRIQATITARTATTLVASSSVICNDPVTLTAPVVSGATYAWLRDGQAVAGATGNVLATSTPGAYTVNITGGSSGCLTPGSATVLTAAIAMPTITLTNGTLSTTANAPRYQWLFTGTVVGANVAVVNAPIQGATSANYRPLTDGSYRLQVETAQGCRAISAAINVTGTRNRPGRVENGEVIIRTSDEPLLVYPNPAVNIFEVELVTDNASGAVAKLFATDGRLIRQFDMARFGGVNSATVDASDLASAVYILQVTQNGQEYKTRVLIRK